MKCIKCGSEYTSKEIIRCDFKGFEVIIDCVDRAVIKTCPFCSRWNLEEIRYENGLILYEGEYLSVK